MTADELIKFRNEMLHEAELEVSGSIDKECRLGYGWDDEILDAYREIIDDLFLAKDITQAEFDELKSYRMPRQDDDHGEDQLC